MQSDNLIFRTSLRLTKRIADGMGEFGFRLDVILRTAEMRDVIARNPFAQGRGVEPGKLLVSFSRKC